MNQVTRLLVVIVNYQTTDLVMQCLDSLRGEVEAIGGVEVVVSDNASGDDSVRLLGAFIEQRGYGAWCRLLPLERNGGFAYGNNECIRDAQSRGDLPEYILLLNPDTYIRRGAFKHLMAYMDQHPEVGIAGSRLEDPDGTPQRSAFRFHTLLSEVENGFCFGPVSRILRDHVVACPVSDEPVRTDWVAGASMMIRRDVIDRIGLMDEAFFMYYEEVDFCKRAADAGFHCAYVPASRVVHLVGQASGVTDKKVRRRRPGYWFDSRRRYFLKHHGALKSQLIDLLWVLGRCTFRFRNAVCRRPDPDPPGLIWDLVRHSVIFHSSSDPSEARRSGMGGLPRVMNQEQ